MSHNLVIVESPSKAKAISGYLGSDYIVLASNGHIRNIPAKQGAVEPDRDFFIHYEIPERSKKQLLAIEKAIARNKCSQILIATDPDREGEAIGWHIVEALASRIDINKIDIRRVSFNEITKSAVKYAVQHPRDIDICLVNAQQARSSLDYLIGFSISPVLWRKLPGSRSAGRVQSVALRMICDREHEVDQFVPQEYHTIEVLFDTSRGNRFTTQLAIVNGKKLEKFDIGTAEEAEKIVQELRKKNYAVCEIKTQIVSRNPSPPFITSTLQQEASRKLGFSPSRTMRAAQKLYEGSGDGDGLITYMRTDGLYVSADAIDAVRKYISKKIGEDYITSIHREYKKKIKNAQEAHEAIRPTDAARTPDGLKEYLGSDEYKIYDLIWKRMVASQMASAKFERLSVYIRSDDKKYELKASGSKLIFDGFLKIYNTEEDVSHLDVVDTDKIAVVDVMDKQHFTDPPPRYSEASLIANLEECGIGRPSTYASIINVLQDREYVENKNRVFYPTARGRVVAVFLKDFFSKYVEYDYTASMEEDLDAIANGGLIWKEFLRLFWISFAKNVQEVLDKRSDVIMDKLTQHVSYLMINAPEGKCPKCSSGELKLRVSRHGPFLCCSLYPACNYSYVLGGGEVSQYPKILGINPESSKEIIIKSGPYGLYVQDGVDNNSDEKKSKQIKPKRASIPKGMEENLTLDRAVKLLSMPILIGNHPDTNMEIKVGIGRFGPYIHYNDKFISINSKYDVLNLKIDEALDILSKSRKLKEGEKSRTITKKRETTATKPTKKPIKTRISRKTKVK